MGLPTIAETIEIGDISVYLASNDNGNGALYGRRINSPVSPISLALITDALRWGYEGGAQTVQGVRNMANYLFWLCGKYGQQAQVVIGSTGGGTVIPAGSSVSFLYYIDVPASSFSDATTYNDSRIAGKDINVFWNNIPRFLNDDEFSQPDTGGITILIEGFDAQGANSDADFKIFIINPSGTNQNPTNSNTRVIS